MHHLFAYLDAASGSILIQAAIAGLVAVPIVLRRQVSRGARALRRLMPGASGPQEHPEAITEDPNRPELVEHDAP